MIIQYTSPKLVSSFQFLVANRPTTPVVSDIFSCDLDGDGVEELLFAGRQSQPATISTWTNSTVHLFKANGTAWTEVTSSWLPDNVIIGTEPSVNFGDFNRDGRIDFFIAADTDMDYLVPSYLFLNTGNTFTKQAFDFQTWAHGSYVADVNKDGYLDVLSTDYGPRTGIGFGSATGFTYKPTEYRGPSKASGICAADFLGDGSMTILISDDMGVNSTVLYKWFLNEQSALSFEKISTLPTPRFELSKWDSYNFEGTYGNRSHDVRIIPFDFSGDGLMDAIEISRPWFTNGQWPEYSEIQFLLNTGHGIFKDVTDEKLIGYNNASSASYQPQLIDANGDGKIDIFLSGTDFTSNNSTTLLLQQADGTFLDYGRENFSDLWNEALAEVKKVITSWIYSDFGLSMHLVIDPDNNVQVIGSVAYQNSEGLSNYVFSSILRFYEVTSGNDQIFGTVRNDKLNGEAGFDTLICTNASNKYSLTPNTRDWNITDKTGVEGTDTLINVEKLQFTDRSVIIESQSHDSYADLPTELYQFFITAFNAAPGVTYMDQLAEAYRYGLSVKQIVDIFTTKKQFTDVYSPSLSHSDLATQLVNNIVKNSASASAKTEAIADIKGALDIGWTVGDVIYTVFGNLAHKNLSDPNWGNTAKQFNNEIAVAKFYTEVLNQSTTDLETLRDVIQPVTQATDVSSDVVIAQLVGVALMNGGTIP